MNNKLAFLLGIVVGAAGAWYFVKKKYEQIAQEEIDSVKEVFSRHEESSDEKNIAEERDTKKAETAKPALEEYAKRIERAGYTRQNEKDKRNEKKPYVIPPEEFGQMVGDDDDYELISFTYYSDGILTDDGNEPIDDADIDYLIGRESLSHFGEYEDDSVYVRNERLRADYEILRDLRTYEESIDPRQ